MFCTKALEWFYKIFFYILLVFSKVSYTWWKYNFCTKFKSYFEFSKASFFFFHCGYSIRVLDTSFQLCGLLRARKFRLVAVAISSTLALCCDSSARLAIFSSVTYIVKTTTAENYRIHFDFMINPIVFQIFA